MVDAKHTFDEDYKIVLNATTGASTNLVDLGDIEDNRFDDVTTTERGPVNGDIWLIVSVSAAADVAGNLTVSLQDSLTAAGSYADLVPDLSSGALAQATLVAGYIMLDVPLPRKCRRFLALEWETSQDWTSSTGTFSAYLYYGHRKGRALASA